MLFGGRHGDGPDEMRRLSFRRVCRLMEGLQMKLDGQQTYELPVLPPELPVSPEDQTELEGFSEQLLQDASRLSRRRFNAVNAQQLFPYRCFYVH